MELVVHHVLQALIEHRTHEYIRRHLFARVATVQHLVAVRLQAALLEFGGDTRRRHILVERRGVTQESELAAQAAQNRLHELGDGHAARNTVRINDNVGNKTTRGLGHVLGLQNKSARALLAMTAGELIADDGCPLLTNTDLHKGIAFAVPATVDAVHVAGLVGAHEFAGIAEALSACCLHRLGRCNRRHGLECGVIDTGHGRTIRSTKTNRCDFSNEHIILRYIGVFGDNAIVSKFPVIRQLHVTRRCRARTAESLLLTGCLILLLLVLVSPVELTAEQATVQRGPINHDGVLLVVAAVRHNRDDHVEAGGHRLSTVEATHVRARQWHRRIPEEIGHGIHALAEIQGIDTHRLFAHRRLVGIARCLIVIRKGNVGRHRT